MEAFVVALAKGTLPVTPAPVAAVPSTVPAPALAMPQPVLISPTAQFIEKRFPISGMEGQTCKLVAASGDVRLDDTGKVLVWRIPPFQPATQIARVALLLPNGSLRVEELRNSL